MRVVLVSDTHLTGRTAAFGANWRAVRRWIEALEPDLVVHLGDITADGAHEARELEAARAVFADLPTAMRFLPGNHDIGDNPVAPNAPNDHPLDLDRLTTYRRLFGPDRWSFDLGRWQVIGLNAQLFATGTDEEETQFAWLADQVGRRSGPLGLMLHKPLFRNGPLDAEAHVRYVPAEARRRLLAVLAARDLRFVVSGHTHQARRLEVDGVEHMWVPSTAYYIPDSIQERIGRKIVGAVTLELTDTGQRFQVVTPSGLVQHSISDYPEVYPSLTGITASPAPVSTGDPRAPGGARPSAS
jgi:3',5'-cyclic AMP phosphodiesterase CpdA